MHGLDVCEWKAYEVKDGKILYQFNLGGGRANLTHNTMVNDGEWHELSVGRLNNTGVLYVDGEMGKLYSKLCCKVFYNPFIHKPLKIARLKY